MTMLKMVFAIAVCLLCLAGIYHAQAQAQPRTRTRILFLSHSTGSNIWGGGVKEWFAAYNASHGTAYTIEKLAFPKKAPYGWANYPYDYWNIWVNHAGLMPYKEEPTLELLTKHYDVIVFKHCFPVSSILTDTGAADIASAKKTLGNYQLQYNALKEKMRQFPNTIFVVWTGAVQVKSQMTPENAENAKKFFTWVRDVWDEKGDNIFVWDFYSLEVNGGLYLDPQYAASPTDSHPNKEFSKKAASYFCTRLANILNGQGDGTEKRDMP